MADEQLFWDDVQPRSRGRLPEPTTTTQPFWDAAHRHVLSIQRCKGCGVHIFYPRPACPECGSVELEWNEVSARMPRKPAKALVTVQIEPLVFLCTDCCNQADRHSHDSPEQHVQHVSTRRIHVLDIIEDQQGRAAIGNCLEHSLQCLGDTQPNGFSWRGLRLRNSRISAPQARRHSTRFGKPEWVRPAHCRIAAQCVDEIRNGRKRDAAPDFLTGHCVHWPNPRGNRGSEPADQ